MQAGAVPPAAAMAVFGAAVAAVAAGAVMPKVVNPTSAVVAASALIRLLVLMFRFSVAVGGHPTLLSAAIRSSQEAIRSALARCARYLSWCASLGAVVVRLVPVVAGGDAVQSAEGAGEICGVGESPAGCDGVDWHVPLQRVSQVSAAVFEALAAYPGTDSHAVLLEKPVQ